MKRFLKLILYYLLITFNTFVFAAEDKGTNDLKIGVLVPLSGEFKSLGEEVIYSINLGLHDIGNPNVRIYPKDHGSNKEKLIASCEEFRDEGIKIILGPVESKYLNELKQFDDLIFISLSNIFSKNHENIIMTGINLESQLIAIKKFLKKSKKNKTAILFPKNEYSTHINESIKMVNLQNTKIFKYEVSPEKITKQIEKLTNYRQRKINLESRIKKLEKSEEPKDIRELNDLKQKYTLGKINYDSFIIIDFGDSLKSVLTSLVYTDVAEKDVLIISGNQWFDESILSETSIKNFYFPSINYKNFTEFNERFLKIYNYKPNEISILAYDSIGLIYYTWKNNGNINSIKNFNFDRKIKAKIGNFSISENKVIQDLNMYKVEENKFILEKF